jgi:hypothetical protein
LIKVPVFRMKKISEYSKRIFYNSSKKIISLNIYYPELTKLQKLWILWIWEWIVSIEKYEMRMIELCFEIQ